jgi:hypothetical protein
VAFTFTTRGSFRRTEKMLRSMQNLNFQQLLSQMGQAGVTALASATPKQSGLAASSWSYKIVQKGRVVSIIWTNSNEENGFPVAIMLQYGYGTGTGGYVQGRDYINPAMKPIFDKIAETVWKAVKSA